MSTIDIISLVSSLVSIFLGVFAIALSLVLYRWSNEAAERSHEAARNMEASVKRLEQLFDRLYSDTFSMVKDTYTDIRQHMWPNAPASEQVDEAAERKADAKVELVKQSLDTELTRLLEKQSNTNTQINLLANEVRSLLSRAISETRRVEEEARDESIREVILRHLGDLEAPPVLGELTEVMNEKYGIGASEVMDELERLKEEGVVQWPTNKRNLSAAPVTILRPSISPGTPSR